MSPRPTAYSAIRWILAGSLVQRLAGVVGLGIIARLVSEEAYGAFRQLMSLHLIAMVLIPLGMDQLVIREVDARPVLLKGLRGLLPLTVLGFSAVLLAGHPLWVRLLGMERYGNLLWFFPLVLAIQGIKMGIKPLLVAEMAFRRISVGEFLYSLVLKFGGAGLLVFWPGAGALYAAYAAGELVEVWWLWRGRDLGAMARIRESLRTGFQQIRIHRRFCGILTTDQVFNAFSANTPILLLGGLMGQSAVAVFAMASTLISIPVHLLVGAIARVTFPALAGRAEADLQAKALLTVRMAAAFIPPVLLWLAFFAPTVVWLVLGPGWVGESAPLLKWLALYLVFVSFLSPISSLDVLRNRPEVSLLWNLATLLLRSAALYWGSRTGNVETAIAAYGLVSAAMWFLYGILLAWLLRCGYGRFFLAWMRCVPLWALAALGWWAVRHLLGADGWIPVLASLLPGMLYFGGVLLLDREARTVLERLSGGRLRLRGTPDDPPPPASAP